MPVPFWVSYKDIIEFAGGTPVFVETDEAENFRVTAEMIEAAITTKTKAIILNTPSNPSGAVLAPKTCTRLCGWRIARASMCCWTSAMCT